MPAGVSVMVAGVGGASLGTELVKSLRLAGGYAVYGCDVSETAYGLYDPLLDKAFRIDRNDYVEQVKQACAAVGARFLIPGGEQPMVLLAPHKAELAAAGIVLIANAPEIVADFADKARAFDILGRRGVVIPLTVPLTDAGDLEAIGLPCIVKPATGSGGSAAVFFAVTADEAMLYAAFIRQGGATPLAQEYVDIDEGEFTIGVLSLPDGTLVGSIALRRALEAKLSVSYRGRGGVISSGYSQGYIDAYPDLCAQAEQIAEAIGSRGPINIQGRVRDGVLLPFEINPRLSASTYLRAMAGFNEVDLLIRSHLTGKTPPRPAIRSGWYLRSLTEQYVSPEAIQ